MNGTTRVVLASALAATAAGALRAQTPAIPVLTVSAPIATTTETIGTLLGLKHLPDGKLLVNDAKRRRVLLYDASLATFTVVIDSAAGTANSYGPRMAPIVPSLGDSTFFVDYGSQSLLVIDPHGKIVRVTTPPKASDLMWLTNGFSGTDARGRLVYRGYERVPPAPRAANDLTSTSVSPDSAPIVRADFDTRTVDTVARFKVASGSKITTTRSPSGTLVSAKQVTNPLQWVDDWTLHSDGSIAILRGRDYHFDWIDAAGNTTSTPKMPFDWRRLSDDDKKQLVDSVQKLFDSLSTAGQNYMTSMTSGPNGTVTTKINIEMQVVPPSEIPDYYPSIRTGAIKADYEGNIWVLPYTSSQASGSGLVYDIVNRKGEVYQRVQLPEKRSLAGFGPGGIVYLMTGDLTNGFVIERVRIQQKTPAS